MNTVKYFLAACLLLLCNSTWAGALSCTIFSISPLSFGTYVAGQATVVDTTATIVLNCNKVNANVTMTINSGNGGQPGNGRAMSSGASKLVYQIYSDAARTAVYGTIGVVTDALKATLDSYYVYGRLFANQDVVPGAYTDTLTVTVLP